MAAPRTISLDAMGGDKGPAVVVPGAALALEKYPEIRFLLVGDQARIQPHLDQHPELAARSRIVHTDIVIEMQDKPSQALRRGRGSSMWRALDAVQKGEAEVAVSAGNTGALMALAKLVLRTMPGIERPVIAGQWPTVGMTASCSTSAPTSAPPLASSPTSRSWARPWHARCSASSGRAWVSSTSAWRR